MHTIRQLPEPNWPRRFHLPFKAIYWDGPHICGRGFAADPITAYHAAVLNALNILQQNTRLRARAGLPFPPTPKAEPDSNH